MINKEEQQHHTDNNNCDEDKTAIKVWQIYRNVKELLNKLFR